MGVLMHVEGRLDDAARFLERALEQHRDMGHRGFEGWDLGHLAAVEHARGHPERAAALYREALALGGEIPDRAVEGRFYARLGSCADDTGDREGARTAFDRALAVHRSLSDPRLGALAFGLLGRLEARTGDFEAAARTLEAAARHARDARDATIEAVVRVLEGYLDLGRGDRAGAEARAAAGGPPSIDLAHARAALARDLAASSSDAVVIATDGAWFEAGGERVSLLKRKAPRLVLARLMEERRERPGTTLSVDDLFEAGWPGEQALPDAAASRVYVAVSTLRKLGLRDVLTREDEGYLLDPRRPVRSAD
jgi:tetratricopeptide (TPR) repeat protein